MTTLPSYSFDTAQQLDHCNDVEGSSQQTHALAIPDASFALCPSDSKPGPVHTPRARRHKESQQLICGHRDCTHKGTFQRRWELKRHIKAKHTVGPGSFVCRAEGCFNKQMTWTFTRPDKLTAHIKAVHTRDTLFTACPVNACAFGFCTLETLGVHIERTHGMEALIRKHSAMYMNRFITGHELAHEQYDAGRAVFNATTCKVRKCPLWQCGKHVNVRGLLSHVVGHSKDDVLAAGSRLQSEGLVVSQPNHTQRGLVITVACPMCNTMSDDIDHFVTHLWTNHLFLSGSGGADHFKAWKSTLIHHALKPIHGDIKDLLPWADLRYTGRNHKGAETIECSLCLFSSGGHGGRRRSEDNMKPVSTHHISLLRPEAEVIAELYPYRIQILRLYPEFVSHPVFADFDPPQRGIASSSLLPGQSSTGFMDDVENHGQSMSDLNTPS
jgi:hypothetical protein